MVDEAEQRMLVTLAELGQFLGHPVKTYPLLSDNEWCWDSGGAVVISHNIWQCLNIPVFDEESILPDEVYLPSIASGANEHSAD